MENTIETLLKNIAEKEGILNYEVQTTSGSSQGDGYIGKILIADIIGNDNQTSPKKLSLIIKHATTDMVIRSKIKLETVFMVEIHAYKKAFAILKQFELEKGLNPSKISPKFYYGVIEYNKELLVLENLKIQGFKLHDIMVLFDDNHADLVLSTYGKLHALSFALRDQQPKRFEELRIDDILPILFNTFKGSFIGSLKKSIEALDVESDLEARNILNNYMNNIDSFINELTTAGCGEYTAFLHADCWKNNMMFKYDENNQPIEVRLYDFQASRVGVPVLDLAYFFYSNCPADAYDSLERYLDVYYQSFCSHVKKLGSNPLKLYPYNILQEQWRKFAKISLLFTPITLHAMSPEGQKIDLKQTAESDKDFSSAFNCELSNYDVFNSKMRTLILHLIKNKCL